MGISDYLHSICIFFGYTFALGIYSRENSMTNAGIGNQTSPLTKNRNKGYKTTWSQGGGKASKQPLFQDPSNLIHKQIRKIERERGEWRGGDRKGYTEKSQIENKARLQWDG